jgi:hypothetical protein
MSLALHGRSNQQSCSRLQLHRKAEQGDSFTLPFLWIFYNERPDNVTLL